MSNRTNALKLILPAPGTINWGPAVNKNFQILDTQIAKIYNNLNTVENLVGGAVPYINRIDDHAYVEVTIEGTPAEITQLKYYKTPDTKGTYITYTKDNNGFADIPAYTGAYVLNKNSFTIDGVTYQRGDVIVKLSEFRGIYEETYESVVFKQYPVMDRMYVPKFQEEGGTYSIYFEKSDVITYENTEQISLAVNSSGLRNSSHKTTDLSKYDFDNSPFLIDSFVTAYNYNVPVQTIVNFTLKKNSIIQPVLLAYHIEDLNNSGYHEIELTIGMSFLTSLDGELIVDVLIVPENITPNATISVK